jgi:hypothetical protein
MKRSPLSAKAGTLICLTILWGLPVPAHAWMPWFAAPQGAMLHTATESTASVQQNTRCLQKDSQVNGTEHLLSAMSKEVAGKVFYQMKEDDKQVMDSRVAVVCAVPLSDLKRETEFGRAVAEYYLTDLADRGIQVKELRLGKDITILPQTGEFILTQNTGELANDSPELDYVVVSTFTNTKKTLILQGRMVSLHTGLVKTSWRYTMPLNQDLVTLLGGRDQPFIIAVKGFGDTYK